MKIKTGKLFLALGLGLATAMVAGLTGCATDSDTADLKHSPATTPPTWNGDDHTPPVYTSPATAPAHQQFASRKYAAMTGGRVTPYGEEPSCPAVCIQS